MLNFNLHYCDGGILWLLDLSYSLGGLVAAAPVYKLEFGFGKMGGPCTSQSLESNRSAMLAHNLW